MASQMVMWFMMHSKKDDTNNMQVYHLYHPMCRCTTRTANRTSQTTAFPSTATAHTSAFQATIIAIIIMSSKLKLN